MHQPIGLGTLSKRHDSPPFTYRPDKADPTGVTLCTIEARDEKRWRELRNGVAQIHIHRDRKQIIIISVKRRRAPLFKRCAS
jgi:hypothetical protein